MLRLLILAAILFSTPSLIAQDERIDNKLIIEMSKAGLSTEIILRKITSSQSAFDVSASGLIELKTSGVDENIITAMMELNESKPSLTHAARLSPSRESPAYSESGVTGSKLSREDPIVTARTIAFGKSSLQPSRQALEKELLKRKDFRSLNLTILRYKEEADLFVDIGFVSGSWVTHRYVYRIYDRRSGAVITAGETTSWGSLAENLARHIAKRLTAARSAKST